MSAIGLGHNENAYRAVSLRVLNLDPRGGVARVPGAIKDGVGVSLLRLVVEDQDNLPFRFKPGVVVIAKFGSGDAEAGENYFGGEISVLAIASQDVRVFPLRFFSAADERDEILCAVGRIFDERDGRTLGCCVVEVD